MLEATWNEFEFETSLVVGSVVEARWSENWQAERAKARVMRVNRASVRVLILEGYLSGETISLPRFGIQRHWSRSRNCIAPWNDENA